MLKDRIVLSGNGFQLNRDTQDVGRQAYFITFTMQEQQIAKPLINPINYWDALNTAVQQVENKTFVCVWEMKDNQECEEYFFYFTNGSAQPRIKWDIKRDGKYGESAYMLTLEWLDHQWEKIHKKHIWLKHKKTGRKFSFLKEFIFPMDTSGGSFKDQYIINLPDDVRVEDLIVEGDELLQMKYLILN